jgi:hypothetical protein
MPIDCWAIAMVGTLAENKDFIFAVLRDVSNSASLPLSGRYRSESWDPEPGDEVRFRTSRERRISWLFRAKRTSRLSGEAWETEIYGHSAYAERWHRRGMPS